MVTAVPAGCDNRTTTWTDWGGAGAGSDALGMTTAVWLSIEISGTLWSISDKLTDDGVPMVASKTCAMKTFRVSSSNAFGLSSPVSVMVPFVAPTGMMTCSGSLGLLVFVTE